MGNCGKYVAIYDQVKYDAIGKSMMPIKGLIAVAQTYQVTQQHLLSKIYPQLSDVIISIHAQE